MKEDITQRRVSCAGSGQRCGLVMKEDITQRYARACLFRRVVVWWWKKILHNLLYHQSHFMPVVVWWWKKILHNGGEIFWAAQQLWFGDERRYYTTISSVTTSYTGCGLVMKEDITQPCCLGTNSHLVVVWWWKKILHNLRIVFLLSFQLWFGDERRYYTTIISRLKAAKCCGLVMKEDITQLQMVSPPPKLSCGLVMKEDITQRLSWKQPLRTCCGLVMKEDITQQYDFIK